MNSSFFPLNPLFRKGGGRKFLPLSQTCTVGLVFLSWALFVVYDLLPLRMNSCLTDTCVQEFVPAYAIKINMSCHDPLERHSIYYLLQNLSIPHSPSFLLNGFSTLTAAAANVVLPKPTFLATQLGIGHPISPTIHVYNVHKTRLSRSMGNVSEWSNDGWILANASPAQWQRRRGSGLHLLMLMMSKGSNFLRILLPLLVNSRAS